tara:strand:- start:3 stop:560 length:558 start_codon:yes stop_codon:yes gene_type:complete
MAKKKKLTQREQRDLNYKATQKALDDGYNVTVDPEAVIDVPMTGMFRDYLGETLNYLFTIKDEQEVIKVLAHIKNGLKDIPKDAPYDGYLNSVWTLITIITEFNHQAATQGKTIVTKEKMKETMATFISSFDIGSEEDTENLFKREKEISKAKTEHYNKLAKESRDNNKESDYDGEKAGQTSSED